MRVYSRVRTMDNVNSSNAGDFSTLLHHHGVHLQIKYSLRNRKSAFSKICDITLQFFRPFAKLIQGEEGYFSQ